MMPDPAEGVAARTGASPRVDRSRLFLLEADEHAVRLSRTLRWELVERLARLGFQGAPGGQAGHQGGNRMRPVGTASVWEPP